MVLRKCVRGCCGWRVVGEREGEGDLQAHYFAGDGVGPGHEEGELAFGAVDGGLGDVVDAHVGLVEHVAGGIVRLGMCDERFNLRIPVETEQVAQRRVSGQRQQVIESSLSGRGVDPFLQGAGWQIAVVVNNTGPSRHDIDTSVAVSGHSGIQRPEGVVGVEKKWSSVVSNDVDNAIVLPCLKSICVVQAGNGRRDDALGTEALGSIQSHLFKPCLVERDFLRSVRIRRIGEVFVGTIDN